MLKKTIASPNPHRPLPVIWPNSVWVNPNCLPQSSRIPLRMEKPIPAAISVTKLARNNRRSSVRALVAGEFMMSCDFLGFPPAAFDMNLGVAAASFEVRDQEEVEACHRQRDERRQLQGHSTAMETCVTDHFLVRGRRCLRAFPPSHKFLLGRQRFGFASRVLLHDFKSTDELFASVIQNP